MGILVKWCLSLALVVIMMGAPLPDSLYNYRPDLFFLFIIYWYLVTPGHLGLVSALITGLIEDVVYFTPLGLHVIVAVFSVLLLSLLRLHLLKDRLMQLYMVIFGLILIKPVSIMTTQSMLSAYEPSAEVWLSCVTTIILYTLMHQFLSRKRMRPSGK